MNCNNCGTLNSSDSKFCIKCGAPLNQSQINNGQGINTPPINSVVNPNPSQGVTPQPTYVDVQQPVQPQVIPVSESVITSGVNQTNSIVSNAPLNYLMYIIAILLKPFKCFKEEESKLANTKNSLILSAIVAGAMMLIELIKAMISSVFVKSLDYTTWEYKTTFDISGLKNLDYLQLIGKNLLIYAGIIVVIALVYYLVSLIFKKQPNFIKLLAITASSLIPFVLVGMVVAPILSNIWADLNLILLVLGALYSIIIFMTLINNEINIEDGDIKIYFNLICAAVIVIAGYYLIINLITSAITSDFGSLLNMFG